MGIHEIPTIPPRTLVPTTLTAHKALDVVDWGVTSAMLKGQFTPTHGNRVSFTRDVDLTYRIGDIFSVPHNTSTNFRVSINAGTQHYGNVEVQLLEQRWPNNLLGYSFEYRQDSTRNNSLFMRYYAHVWWGITNNTHRTWGVDFDGESRKESNSYYYNYVNLDSEEQQWQDEGWRFKGWIFNFRSTKGTGSSFTSSVDFFNMKLHAGRLESTTTTNREVLPAIRPSSEAYNIYF